jgi:hypothetical protein
MPTTETEREQMIEPRSNRHGLSLEGSKQLGSGEKVRVLVGADEEILHALSAGMPLPYLLNRICSVLDCEIGNVVSLICMVGEETADFAVIADNAKKFGLHRFDSTRIEAANHRLLGTLETYSCERGQPSPGELDLMQHAACLAATAIEGRIGIPENAGDESGVAKVWPPRNPVLDWPAP